jgi:hypothetical protein
MFTDGSRFRFERVLGEGGTTKVLAVREVLPSGALSDMMALRIPLTNLGSYERPADHTPFINETIRAERALRRAGVPIPKFYKSLRSEYVAVELVPTDFSGLDFVFDPQNLLAKGITPAQLAEAEERLVEFARRMAPLVKVGDFFMHQVSYSIEQKRWVLLDWRDDTFRRGFLSWLTGAPPLFGPEFWKTEAKIARDTGLPELDEAGTERERRIAARMDQAWRHPKHCVATGLAGLGAN